MKIIIIALIIFVDGFRIWQSILFKNKEHTSNQWFYPHRAHLEMSAAHSEDILQYW